MKKRNRIIFFIIVIIGLGCYFIASGIFLKNNLLSSKNDIQNKHRDKASEICNVYFEINNLLSKTSKGSENNMAKFLGFSDILNSISDEASSAISKSNDITALIKSCKSDSRLDIYDKDIKSFKDKLVKKSDIIKKAKQDKDVDTLSQALKDMLQLLEDYNSYLDKVLDELK